MDELMERYVRLSNQIEFNPATFSLDWEKLAADFDATGRLSMAATCRSRGNFYGGLMGTSYERQYIGVSHVMLVCQD